MLRKLLCGSIALALAISVVACGSSSEGSSSPDRPRQTPLTGAGSRLVVPLMAKWRAGYARETDAKVTYHPVGAGLDVKSVGSGVTDFGVSDAPVTPVQFGGGERLIAMVPWSVTGIAVVYNVKGISKGLRLNSDLLVDILLGETKTWNDPAIARLNPDVTLPDTRIIPVYRVDESGEAYALSNYLSANSPKYLSQFGVFSRRLDPHEGVGVKRKGGVSAKVGQTDGAIGFLELPLAVSAGLDIARIENPAGSFPAPNAANMTLAAENGTRRGPNTEVWIKELPASAKDAYPLLLFSYAVVPVETKSAEATALRKFFTYVLGPQGQSTGAALHFAPLPKKIMTADQRKIASLYG
jgi:phosphate transport system substrate-binding protein